MTEFVSCTLTYSKVEYMLAMKRHYVRRLSVRRDVAGGLVAVSGGIYLLVCSDSVLLAWLLIVPGIVLLGIVAYALFALPSWIYESQPKLKEEYSLHFSVDGIHFKTQHIDANVDWAIYSSWLRDDDFYILYHGRRDLTVVPRRTLSPGEDVQLSELLSQGIGPPNN